MQGLMDLGGGVGWIGTLLIGAIAGWIAEQGLTPTDELWEIYETEPTPDLDPNVLRTVLFWPLRA